MTKISDESLKTAKAIAYALFDCLANSGDLELTKMASDILEKLNVEIVLRGGEQMLINREAVYASFCPKFRKK